MKYELFTPNYIMVEGISQNASKHCDYTKLPRPFTSVAYIISGGGKFKFEGNEDTVREGELIFVPQGAVYDMLWIGSPKTEFISAHFVIESDIFSIQRRRVQSLSSGEHSDRSDFYELLRLYKRLALDGSSHETALELMSKLWSICADILPKLDVVESRIDYSRIAPAIEYIDHSYTQPITITELARLCCMSESQFHIRFKQAMGLTPIEYKNRLAISYAARLLIGFPGLSVEQIAAECGFASSEYFRRVFRKFIGTTPQAYKRLDHDGL